MTKNKKRVNITIIMGNDLQKCYKNMTKKPFFVELIGL